MGLEERLEAISGSIAPIDETLDPYLKNGETPTQAAPNMSSRGGLLAALLQKHAELKAEWESVQKEADTLQSELREDKWLAVFRSVGEQSDTMMNSLEKALANCQVCSLCSSTPLC
jgi:Yeast cortical protein KAR9